MTQRRALVVLAGVLGVLAVLVGAAVTDAATSTVSLRLPVASLHAGRQVKATLDNDSDATLEIALCPILARRVDGRWVTVTHTHGFPIGCGRRDPVGNSARPHSSQTINVEIYDDLTPGTYRVTLPYRPLGTSTIEPPFSPTSRTAASVELTVLAFDPGPASHLSRRRILAIALAAARHNGDAAPTLIQDVEGSELTCALVGTGDLVYGWKWSYLIAERGAFESPPIPTPVGIPTGPGPVRIHDPVITLVVNARTGHVTVSGSSTTYPRLARLGVVSTDRS